MSALPPSQSVSEDANNPYSSTVEPLAGGFLAICQPSLENVEQHLKVLTDKQTELLEVIHSENLSISNVQHSPELQDMFNKVKLYQSKLVNIKKDIKGLHEKSTKLKKRALKLQQLKEKEAKTT